MNDITLLLLLIVILMGVNNITCIKIYMLIREDKKISFFKAEDILGDLEDDSNTETSNDSYTEYNYDIFENVSDFLEYVSNNQLKIINIETHEVKEVKYLNETLFKNLDGDPVFDITFTDGIIDLFVPHKYAKYYE